MRLARLARGERRRSQSLYPCLQFLPDSGITLKSSTIPFLALVAKMRRRLPP
jgi:hypothetical protein